MYDFIKLQYQMGKIDDIQAMQFADKGWITTEQAEDIISKS